jgi:putative ABC transport system permease protein
VRGLGQDLRYAVRLLTRIPGFTIAAVLALALGIGASTTIFSVLSAVLLRPLSYPEADRLVMVWDSNPGRGWDTFAVSPGNYATWTASQSSFDALFAMQTEDLVLTGQGDPERLQGLRATDAVFDLTGARPALGRAFAAADYDAGAAPVVVISDGLWRRRFDARPDILGTAITLNAASHTIVGVLPRDVRLPTGAELLAPLILSPKDRESHGAHYLTVMARLRPGASADAAGTAMRAVALRLEKELPDSNTGWTVRVVPLYEQVTGRVRPALIALGGAVACLLLIACANVANLLLARAAARRGEIAVRSALGARPSRILRQLLTESVVLALAGGGLGILLAVWGIDLVKALPPETLPRSAGIRLDGTTLVFTLALSIVTGLVFGVVPGIMLSRSRLAGALQEGGRAGGLRVSRRVRAGLVAGQVALAHVLLVGAGLHMRSLGALLKVDPGFRPDGVLVAEIAGLPEARYPERPERAAFYDRTLGALRALPGVASVAAVTTVPVTGNDIIFSIEEVEGQPPRPPDQAVSANWYSVSPGYFETMGIPLVAGRVFTSSDAATSPRVAIIDETMARRIFPGENPIGHRLRMGIDGKVFREIVGVVGDVRHYGLDRAVTMQMYEPYAQIAPDGMTFLVRTAGDPGALAGAARRAIQSVDPEQPVTSTRTLVGIVADSTSQRRFTLTLLAAFAVAAMLLAAVGVYGVIAFAVSQRTHEIGVRMALGAERRAILGLVLRQGMAMVLAGVVAGLAAALALTRLVSATLYGVGAADPATYAATATLLCLVAFAATYLPARRATRVEPTTALRCE